MANYELLNNVDHKDIRVIIERSAAYGDAVWFAATFPAEFRNVQSCYPIMFTQNPDNKEFEAVALFGFEDGENLFLDEHGWNANYIPLNIARMPFLIGFQEQQQEGRSTREPVITIDMDSPRISAERGEPLFLEHGGNSPYIEQIGSILKVLHEGVQQGERFYDMLEAMGLLESLVVDIQLDDGTEHRLAGFHTINEDTLRELGAEDLAELNRRGYLEPIYMVIASMSHLPTLIDKKNLRRKMASPDA